MPVFRPFKLILERAWTFSKLAPIPVISTRNFSSSRTCKKSASFSSGIKSVPSTKVNTMNQNVNMKPPNILVVCEDSSKREEVTSTLKSVLANDRYIVYDFPGTQLSQDSSWTNQAALLVVSGKIPDYQRNIPIILRFLGDGGKLFAWCCENPPFGCESIPLSNASKKANILLANGDSQSHSVSVSPPLWSSVVVDEQLSTQFPLTLTSSVVGQVEGSEEAAVLLLDGGALGGKAILSRVAFEETKNDGSSLYLLSVLLSRYLAIDCTRAKNVEYTQGYLLGDRKIIQDFLQSSSSTIQQPNLTIEFVPPGQKGSTPSKDVLPIVTTDSPPNFSIAEFYNNLTTTDLGHLLIYTDVITSTMHVFNGQSLRHGLVVIAKYQTKGRGRGKNVWLSPAGCVSFTTQLNTALSSNLGQRLSLLQHIAALSVILAVPNHKEINLKVKWPNDIYLNNLKIGGVLTETRIEGKIATTIVGIGVNLSNEHPTVSLNSALPPEDKLSPEVFTARALSQMESLLNLVERGEISTVLNKYTDNWVHNMNEVVNVEMESNKGNFSPCQISGVDDYGFLKVKEVNSGHVFSVASDGNSFDIMNKLIAIKSS